MIVEEVNEGGHVHADGLHHPLDEVEEEAAAPFARRVIGAPNDASEDEIERLHEAAEGFDDGLLGLDTAKYGVRGAMRYGLAHEWYNVVARELERQQLVGNLKRRRVGSRRVAGARGAEADRPLGEAALDAFGDVASHLVAGRQRPRGDGHLDIATATRGPRATVASYHTC